MFLVRIGPCIQDFRRRMPVNRAMHPILHRRVKDPRQIRGLVVIDGRRVKVGDLLVEFAFAQANLANALQLVLEVFIRDRRTVFEPRHIHHPALDRVLADDLIGPLAERDGLFVVDLEAKRNDNLQIVVIDGILLAVLRSY